MRLVCKICGRVFERPYFMGESDFCSEKCRKEFLKTLPPPPKPPKNKHADKPFDFHKEIEKIRKAREYRRKYDAKKRLEKKQNENH